MAAPQGNLCMCRQGEKVIFRLEGWVRAAQGLALRRSGEEALEVGATTLWVDLRYCTHMDSTFLGTLLYLQRTVNQLEVGDFALVSPSAQCHDLLNKMSLDGVFRMITAQEADAICWEVLCCEGEKGDGFKAKVVQAHQELANLPGKAGEPFREVVRGLMQDPHAAAARPDAQG
jgi:anti-anti-sigma regulatory factor